MPEAGDKLRAADVRFLSDRQGLPDAEEIVSANTWQDWGSPIAFADPGIPVSVMAWGTGTALNDGDGSGVAGRIGISIDGGASWTYGAGPYDQCGSGGSTRRGTVSALHMESTSSAPDSEVQVKMQVRATVTTGGPPTFYDGSIMAMVLPNA